VARVRGLHGLRGLVRVEVLTDRPEARFAVGQVLYTEGSAAPLTIVAAAPVEDGPGWRIAFREIGDRTGAERLRDAYLEIVVDRSADLEPGAAYWHEVIGTEVRDTAGRVMGTVADIYRVAGAEVFIVRGGPFGEFDVPLVKEIVPTFAPERGEIIVDETALDLEAPPVDSPPPKPRRRPRWSRHGKGRPGAIPDGETAEPGQDGDGAGTPTAD
jgi:16S rRNA processing protein RimM